MFRETFLYTLFALVCLTFLCPPMSDCKSEETSGPKRTEFVGERQTGKKALVCCMSDVLVVLDLWCV